MQKITIIIIIFIAFWGELFSQTLNTPQTVLSPNIASLGEFGNIPVSQYSGLFNIDIPLHEIKIGKYIIPIQLKYLSGGIRPDQHPGWVGIGWNLHAGGCISRIINGETDEFKNPKMTYDSVAGYYYRHAYYDFELSLNQQLLNVAHDTNFYDTAPDKFSFNFLDYHGNFYMGTDGKWKVQCNKNVQILFEGEDADFTRFYSETSERFSLVGTNAETFGRSHHFKKFTIIGEDGTRYIFGESDDAIEYSINFFNQITDHLKANVWHLIRIEYPDNHVVRFSYERSDFIVQMYENDYCKTIKIKSSSGDYSMISGNNSPNDRFSGALIMPSYLKTIEYDYGNIYFEKANSNEMTYDLDIICNSYANASNIPQKSEFMPILARNGVYEAAYRDFPRCLAALKWKKLLNIQISARDTSYKSYITKKIKFEYTDTITERLSLKAVSIIPSNDSDNAMTYKFEYNNSNLLPQYMSTKTDHWGFYNATPSPRVHNTNYTQSRSPNPEVSDYGALSKITYPTGGYSRFLYEPHEYFYQVTKERNGVEKLSSVKTAGGIRIKRIIQSPSGNSIDEYTDKEYYYVTDFLNNGENSTESSGILTQLYQYEHLNKVLPAQNYEGGTITLDTYGSQSFLPSIGNISNNHIEYSEVAEKNADGTFTIYKYTNFSDGHADEPTLATLFDQPSIYEPSCAKDQERGLLKSQIEYNNIGQKSKEIIYEYEKTDSSTNSHVPIFKTQYNYFNVMSYAEGAAYYAYTYLMRPKKVTEIEYFSNNHCTTNIEYKYNSLGLLEELKRSNSNETLYTTFKYPDSFQSSGTQYNLMCQQNRITPVVEKIQEAVDNTGERVTIKKTFYHYDKNTMRPSSIDIAYGNNSYTKIATYEHDSYGNIIIENPMNAPSLCHIWSYKGQRLVATLTETPVAFVSAVLNTFNRYSELFKPEQDKISLISTNPACKGIITYDYNTEGLLEKITDINGRSKTYYYDGLGRLLYIRNQEGKLLESFRYNYAH